MKENRFRCHFSVVLENLGSAFWVILMCFVMQLDNLNELIRDIARGGIQATEALIGIGVLFGVLLFIFLIHAVIWSKTWISIEDEAIVIEKRTINRKINTIGMKNISNINMEQNILERILGTYKIKLDTNSKSTADSTDVKIVLSKEMAIYFKDQVMLHMNEEVESKEKKEEVKYDVEYSPKDIIMHCVYTAGIFALLTMIATIIGIIVGIRALHTGTVLIDSIVNVIGSIFAALIIIIPILQSLVKDFFIYFGFRVRRNKDKIYLSYGLLKKRDYAISVDKINAVEIVSPLISRILGRQYVKVICIGVGDEQNENSMILLSENKKNLKKRLDILLPEFSDQEMVLTKRNKKSICSELPSLIIITLLLLVTVLAVCIFNVFDIPMLWVQVLIGIACVGLEIFILVCIYLSFKTCGVCLDDEVLLIQNGMFQRTLTKIPYGKIQQMEYSQGPISRHFGYAKGIIYILANALNSINVMSYFEVSIFDEIQKRILVRQGRKK